MKKFILLKYLIITTILVFVNVLTALVYKREIVGIDSFFLAFSLYFIYYFLPLLILSFLFDQLIIKNVNNKIIRYSLSFVIGGILIAYHYLFILNADFNIKDHFGIILNAILTSPLTVYLCEKILTKRKPL